MAVGDAYVFPGFLTPVLTQLFFPKPATTFPTTTHNDPDKNRYENIIEKGAKINAGNYYFLLLSFF